MKIFTPIESMNPVYLGAADDELYEEVLKEHNGATFAEIKEDGYRMQVHKKGDVIKAYTRSMNEIILELFPELNQSMQNLPDCIIDAELIGDEKIGHEGFDMIKRRFRPRISKKGIEDYLKSGIVKEMPIALRVFDTLYWGDEELLDKPLRERREYTKNILEKKITPSTQRVISSHEELKEWFEELTGKNYEGLVCKNPDSVYAAGKRTNDWIKLKRAETLDLAVLGAYMENEAISQILCGTYNDKLQKFETLAKVNAKRKGMNEEIYPSLKRAFVKKCPKEIALNPAIKEDDMPDYFIQAEKTIVVEVAAMNFNRSKNWHSCGLDDGNAYSLRIGWLKGLRDDKLPKQATTTEQVKKLYEKERTGGS